MSNATKTCPYCAEEIAAAAIKCKHCGSFLDGRGPESSAAFDYPPVAITAPIIVSACWNAVTAAGWVIAGVSFLPCIGLFIGFPYVLLTMYEFSLFQRAATMEPNALHGRCGVLAVLQIVLGLFNLVPVVCGVLLLVYRERLWAYQQSPQV